MTAPIDVSTAYRARCGRRVEVGAATGATRAILKARPSCGADAVYDGTFTAHTASGSGCHRRGVARRRQSDVAVDEDLDRLTGVGVRPVPLPGAPGA